MIVSEAVDDLRGVGLAVRSSDGERDVVAVGRIVRVRVAVAVTELDSDADADSVALPTETLGDADTRSVAEAVLSSLAVPVGDGDGGSDRVFVAVAEADRLRVVSFESVAVCVTANDCVGDRDATSVTERVAEYV